MPPIPGNANPVTRVTGVEELYSTGPLDRRSTHRQTDRQTDKHDNNGDGS